MLTPEINAAIDAAVKRLRPARETYLRIREAAVEINCHHGTILRLVHAGKLRSVGAGKLIRIPLSACTEYLEASSAAAK
jgi:excisionase family DNA binding protein